MIRGPRFGLGTCRYCCRWIFLLVALAALLPLFVHVQLRADVSAGAGAQPAATGSGGGGGALRRRRQQQGLSVQTAPAPPSGAAHQHRKYKPGAGPPTPHDHAGAGVAEEGSILRLLSKNNLYIQSFPNGSVSATGHDSSYYCESRHLAYSFSNSNYVS